MIRSGVAVILGIAAAVWFTRRGAAPLGGDPVFAPDFDSLDNSDEAIPQSAQDAAAAAIDAAKDAAYGTASMIFGTKYDSLIYSAASENGLDPKTLFALLWRESRFRPEIIDGTVRSRTGALGIAQFMPATAREWLGSEAAALDPNQAIPGAARYLAWLVRQFGGDVTKAVAAYNWGIGNVKKKGLAAAPQETRQYVLNILGVNIA